MATRIEKPKIIGTKVVLRPIGAADAADMHRATLDPMSRRLTGTQAHFSLEQVQRWCERLEESDDRVDLAITKPDSGAFLGEVVLNEIDSVNRSANFRIGLAGEEHFGRGYGTEAARLMLKFGFERVGLHRIELGVFSFNERAIHVYEKLGFKREGVRREVLLWDGDYYDSLEMGLLAREFEA